MHRHLFDDIERVVRGAIELEGTQGAASRALSGPDAAQDRLDREESEFKHKLEVLIQKLDAAYSDRPVDREFAGVLEKARSSEKLSTREKSEIVGLLLRFMHDVTEAELTKAHLAAA